MLKRLILGLVFLVASAAWATEIPKLTGPVNDYAKVLTASEVAVLNTKIKGIANTYPGNPQIMVLTLAKLPEEGIDQYANDVYRAWGVGQKGKDNGVLLVMAPNDRKIRIEVGYGLEPVIPDAVANQIIQNMKPDLKAKNWGKAISLAVNELVNALPKTRDVKLESPPEPVKVAPVPAASPTKLADVKIEPIKETSNHSGLGFLLLVVGVVSYVAYQTFKNTKTSTRKFKTETTNETNKSRTNYTNTYVPPSTTPSSTDYSQRPVSRGKAAASARRYESNNDGYLSGLTTGLIVGSASSRRGDSDSYKSSSRDDSWSSSSSSDSSSSSSSSSDSWSGGGGDSGGGGSSDSW